MNKHDLSIVIQGPLHENSLENIDNYLRFSDRVIISTYPDCAIKYQDNPIWKGWLEAIYPNISPVQHVINWIPAKRFFNTCNVFYQAYTTLGGLTKANTTWTIKVRSDESYSDLSEFIKAMMESPNKLTTNNVFFKRTEPEPYHPSDHVVGGLTANLQATYERIMQWCLTYPYPDQNSFAFGGFIGLPFLDGVSPETMLCKAFLDENLVGVPETKDVEKIKQIMKANFNCVPVSKMGNYTWTVKRDGQRLFFNTFDDKISDNSINSLDEL